MTYNRDLQEDKEPVFDSVDTIRGSLEVLAAMLPKLARERERMSSSAATAGFTLATELADYLVSRGIPFRDAHAVVGAIVRHCLAAKAPLESLSVDDLRAFSPALQPRCDAVAERRSGGPAATRPGRHGPDNVQRAAATARRRERGGEPARRACAA